MVNFHQNKAKINTHTILSIVLLIIGIILTLIFSLVFIVGLITLDMSVEGTTGGMIITAILMALGIYLIISDLKRMKLIKSIPAYEMLIPADKEVEIAWIAYSVNKSADVVSSQLKQMILKNYIEGFYNETGTRITLKSDRYNEMYTAKEYIGTQAAVVVQCKNCGASNKVSQTDHAFCEYCGKPLTKIQ